MRGDVIALYGQDWHDGIDSLCILAYICDRCNYNCWYCYNARPRTQQLLDLGRLSLFTKHAIAQTGKKVRLSLIGGETSLHPGLLDFCKEMHAVKEVIDIEIYTNLSKSLSYYLQLLDFGVEVNATWHTVEGKPNDSFLSKAMSLTEEQFKKFYLTVMLEPNDVEESFKAYSLLHNAHPTARSIELSLCLGPNGKPHSYRQEDFERFYAEAAKTKPFKREYFTKHRDGSVHQLTFNDLQGLPENSFKFWKCNAGKDFLYIDSSGKVFKCTHDKVPIMDISSGSAFLPIPVKPTVCQYQYCPCNWEVYRERVFK